MVGVRKHPGVPDGLTTPQPCRPDPRHIGASLPGYNPRDPQRPRAASQPACGPGRQGRPGRTGGPGRSSGPDHGGPADAGRADTGQPAPAGHAPQTSRPPAAVVRRPAGRRGARHRQPPASPARRRGAPRAHRARPCPLRTGQARQGRHGLDAALVDLPCRAGAGTARHPAWPAQYQRRVHRGRARVGRNPHASNGWDINAAQGHPSEGIAQTIGPTFHAYKLHGYGDIWNPGDNMIAAFRYAISRYGSMNNIPGVVAVRQGGSYIGY